VIDGAPLPPEPEPIDPPTGPWPDVAPPISPDAPAFEPVGEPIPLEDDMAGGSIPVLVWNDVDWGAAWGLWGPTRFLTLDVNGVPRTPVVYADLAQGTLGLDFAGGRYALVSAGGSIGTFDRNGTLVEGWASFGGVPHSRADVARLSIDRRWLVAVTDELRVISIDDTLAVDTTLPIAVEEEVDDVRIAGIKTRAMVVFSTRGGVMGQLLSGDPLELLGRPNMLFQRIGVDSGTAVEVFRDYFVVAAVHADGEVEARFVPAFGDSPFAESEPFPVASRGMTDRRPGLAVASERGFAVACYAFEGGTGRRGVVVQAFGADGRPWGAPFTAVTGELNIGDVACGWNGSEIVLVWWRAASAEARYYGIFSQRLRPTF
jgi:hypothetical protein